MCTHALQSSSSYVHIDKPVDINEPCKYVKKLLWLVTWVPSVNYTKEMIDRILHLWQNEKVVWVSDGGAQHPCICMRRLTLFSASLLSHSAFKYMLTLGEKQKCCWETKQVRDGGLGRKNNLPLQYLSDPACICT
jgi:hypothetical protein